MTTYVNNCPQTMTADTSGRLSLLSNWSRHYLQEQRLKRTISKERKQLAKLSAAMLNDIGIDCAVAMQEAQRNDIPASRMAHMGCH